MESVNSIGIGVICVFLVFIFKKSDRSSSDILLSVILLIMLLMLTSSTFIEYKLSKMAFIVQSLASFYIFPVFMSYAYTLIDAIQDLKKYSTLFIISSFVFTVYLFVDFIFLTEYTADQLKRLYDNPPMMYHIMYKSHHAIIISSLAVFLKRLKRYQNEIRNEYSYIEPIRFIWLKNFVLTYLILNIISVIAFLSYNFGLFQRVETAYALLYASMVASLFYLCYHGVNQYMKADLELSTKDMSPKYSTSSLSEKEILKLFKKLQDLFIEEQLHLKTQLKIQDLASKLNTTTHNISQTINSQTNSTFYDYVNGFRVEHLKKLILDDKDKEFTLLALALDSGFNSKASLNRVFKKHTGITPKEFQIRK